MPLRRGGKWEYTAIDNEINEESFLEQVNALGNDGWEAVGGIRVKGRSGYAAAMLLFKRKL